MLGLAPSIADAQRLTAWAEASLAHVQPPAWAEAAAPELFGVAAGRLRVAGEGWAVLDLSAQAGLGGTGSPGTWLGGSVALESSASSFPVSIRLRTEAFGLEYAQPHRYATFGLGIHPAARATVGGFHLSLSGEHTRGQWQMTVVEETRPRLPLLPEPRTGNRESTERGDLRRTGVALEVERRVGRVRVRFGGERYDAVSPVAAGVYEGASAVVSFDVGAVDVAIGAQLWARPGGRDFGYSTTLTVPMGETVSAFANLGLTVTDALYGTPPARAAGAGLRIRLGGTAPRPIPVTEVGARAGSGRPVRFRVAARRARTVALAGTFSAWDPIPMRRDRESWVVELVLEPGLHHFAFVVDDKDWMVPDDAPGVVLDGWGRRNASIVIVLDEPVVPR